MNQLSDINKNRIKYIKDTLLPDFKPNKAWMNRNFEEIVSKIEGQYTKPSTKAGYLSSFSVLADELDALKAKKRFGDLSTEYALEHRESRETGILTANEKKNMHSFINYSIHREICYQDWKNDIRNNQKMYRFLAMAILTLYPPLRRSDYLDLIITKGLPKRKTDRNFLLIAEDGMCSIVLNSPAKTKEQEMAEKAGTKPLNSLLSARILETLKHFPRKYLFSSLTDADDPMSEQSFYRVLDSIYPDSKVRVDYLRKSYESFVEDQRFSTKFRRNISKLLLHNIDTVISFYIKEDLVQEPENNNYKITIALVDQDNQVVVKNTMVKDYQYRYPIVLVEEKGNEPEPVIEESSNKPVVHFERSKRKEVPDNKKKTPKKTPKKVQTPSGITMIFDDDEEDLVEDVPQKTAVEKHKESIKKYMADPNNRAKHLARDYLLKLQKQIILNPKAETLKKHNIVYEDGKYVIKQQAPALSQSCRHFELLA